MLRHVIEFFKQRQIAVGLHIAHRTWIAIPIPGAAKITCFFDHTNVVEPRLAQSSRHQKSAKTAADYGDFHFIVQRRPAKSGLDVRIINVVGKFRGHLDILLVAVVAQAFVSLF